MQFVKDGPEIPDSLLNKHSEKAVVFFCGAGVSMGAGLPSFKSLVEQVAKQSGLTLPAEYSSAFKDDQFDFALSIIERQYKAGDTRMRRIASNILSKRPKSLENHATIMRLSRADDSSFRLVTTNFDRLFLKAAKKLSAAQPIKPAIDAYPGLPSPKKTRWSSIVFLHGILPEKPDVARASDYFRLILTSGDFGEAYLTDANCSRFLVELMRNFVVVFLGYSLNDPVLRYLLDAIAVAESRDESHFIKPFAFAPFAVGGTDAVAFWKQRPVNVIRYEVPAAGSHEKLYETLSAWADLVERGQIGRATWALTEAQKEFLPEDTFTISRMLWAVSDDDGVGAKALYEASAEDTAEIGWLSIFSEYGLFDLALESDLTPNTTDTERVKTGYKGAFTRPDSKKPLHPASRNLVSWLIRHHLNSIELVEWVLENGATLSDEFCRLYNDAKRNNGLKFKSEDNRKLWDFLTSPAFREYQCRLFSDYFLSSPPDLSIAAQKVEFLKIARPVVTLSRSHFKTESPDSLLSQLDVEVVFRGVHVGHSLLDAFNNQQFKDQLGGLSIPLTDRLLDAMLLLESLDTSSADFDPATYKLPSISDHGQNEYTQDLGVLVLLVRHAFDSLFGTQPEQAKSVALLWKGIHFPVFARLFLYAATVIGESLDADVLALLKNDNAKLLWSASSMREVKRYLRKQVQHWKREDQLDLITVVLNGPERSAYREMSDDDWTSLRVRSVRRYLQKLEQGGVALPDGDAASAVANAPALPTDQSDEFLIFSGGDSTEFFENIQQSKWDEFIRLPTEARLMWNWDDFDSQRELHDLWDRELPLFLELIEAGLASEATPFAFWRRVFDFLYNQFRKEVGDAERAEASEEELNANSPFALGVRLLHSLNNATLSNDEVCGSAVEFWGAVRKDISDSRERLDLWDKLWAGADDALLHAGDPYGNLMDAINSPAGKLMEYLLQDLWPQNAIRGMGLPDALKARLEAALNIQQPIQVRVSHVVIASRLQLLHALDKQWATQNIAPLFAWEQNALAGTIWTSFLWKARIDVELFSTLKTQLFEAVAMHDQINDDAFKILLHFIVLGSLDLGAATHNEVRPVISNLANDDLRAISDYLLRRMKNTRAKASEFWLGSIKPWISDAWPRNHGKQSDGTREDFALIAMYADEKFDDALATIEEFGLIDYIPDASELFFFFRRELQSEDEASLLGKLVTKHPRKLLHLLNITRPRSYSAATIVSVLERCVEADPEIAQLAEYQELREFLDRE
ncbi:MAG: SIR2 family protein [Hyphomonas sp.]